MPPHCDSMSGPVVTTAWEALASVTFGDPVDFWPGAITNVGVWNRALSTSEARGVAARL